MLFHTIAISNLFISPFFYLHMKCSLFSLTLPCNGYMVKSYLGRMLCYTLVVSILLDLTGFLPIVEFQVEAKKGKDKDEKKHGKKHHKKKSKHHKDSPSENDSDHEDAVLTVEKQRESHHKGSKTDKPSSRTAHTSDEELSSEEDVRRKKYHDKEHKDGRHSGARDPKYDKSGDQQKSKKSYYDSRREEYSSERRVESRREEYSSERQVEPRHDKRSHFNSSDKPPRSESSNKHRRDEYSSERQFESRREHSSERQVESRHEKRSHFNSSDKPPRSESSNKHRNPVKISEEERAARLREMQIDAELHEQQRWKRLKKAADTDAQEANQDRASLGRNFLDAAQKSVYGAEKGGSSTIEESVRRRTHYLQRRAPAESNAFRRT